MSTRKSGSGVSRRFSAQFKAEAVQMVVTTKKTITEVAKSLGVSPQGLGRWVKAYRDEHPDPDLAPTPIEAARLRALEDENRTLRMENEFLKKAAAFFARTLL
jgi:transposase-like protein